MGPKVDIPETPCDTFELLFTPTLLDDIVEQSNLYAKEVMGDEKFNLWVKITRDQGLPWLMCFDGHQPPSSPR